MNNDNEEQQRKAWLAEIETLVQERIALNQRLESESLTESDRTCIQARKNKIKDRLKHLRQRLDASRYQRKLEQQRECRARLREQGREENQMVAFNNNNNNNHLMELLQQAQRVRVPVMIDQSQHIGVMVTGNSTYNASASSTTNTQNNNGAGNDNSNPTQDYFRALMEEYDQRQKQRHEQLVQGQEEVKTMSKQRMDPKQEHESRSRANDATDVPGMANVQSDIFSSPVRSSLGGASPSTKSSPVSSPVFFDDANQGDELAPADNVPALVSVLEMIDGKLELLGEGQLEIGQHNPENHSILVSLSSQEGEAILQVAIAVNYGFAPGVKMLGHQYHVWLDVLIDDSKLAHKLLRSVERSKLDEVLDAIAEARQAEAKKQADAKKQAEAKKQVDAKKQAEAKKQADAKKQAEAAPPIEEVPVTLYMKSSNEPFSKVDKGAIGEIQDNGNGMAFKVGGALVKVSYIHDINLKLEKTVGGNDIWRANGVGSIRSANGNHSGMIALSQRMVQSPNTQALVLLVAEFGRLQGAAKAKPKAPPPSEDADAPPHLQMEPTESTQESESTEAELIAEAETNEESIETETSEDGTETQENDDAEETDVGEQDQNWHPIVGDRVQVNDDHRLPAYQGALGTISRTSPYYCWITFDDSELGEKKMQLQSFAPTNL